jgi:hypothetical protein
MFQGRVINISKERIKITASHTAVLQKGSNGNKGNLLIRKGTNKPIGNACASYRSCVYSTKEDGKEITKGREEEAKGRRIN